MCNYNNINGQEREKNIKTDQRKRENKKDLKGGRSYEF